ncbi:LTA synthase family protein [Pusillimonas sp. DMV24BSW_D]|uniref:LTA synthase family protein n=1 Tax=Neopusillimonas aestuarii TaxID=2716226 RepID=UPI00140E1154|nr:LTA synthase family protein [Pusillimonas sp. DMV24BSW_D]QIM50115.1 LTA synthase family protein [Pusillimonas sp. DMV24BSW_D]
MFQLTLIFILASFVLLTASRLLLAGWQWRRVQKAGGLLPILIGGLRIDAHQIAILAGIPLLASFWLGDTPFALHIAEWWFQLAWLLLGFLELATPQFITEYDSRPNRLFVEYLEHPKEVFGMLWKGYKTVIICALALLGVLGWVGHLLFGHATPDLPLPVWQAAPLTLVSACIIFLAIRGTLRHRPINPSTVAYCGDGLLNTLPLNSLYNVTYAIYSKKNERSAADVYGNLDSSEILNIVRKSAHIDGETLTPAIPTLHKQIADRPEPSRPKNIVIIVEESLGAQYVANLGGQKLTPNIDQLAGTAWNFTRAYATGTRSVRGLEAISAGFPPTLSDAALRLPGAQSRFFTLAQLLKNYGYHSRFVYGGEAHFDNMKSFFLGNGFDSLHERESFNNPAFIGTWGASDEDMFNKVHSLLNTPSDQPSLTLAFTVTNHSPWEYPAGRIDVQGDPATVENTVRYSDWALGAFFEKAKESTYWDNTLFLIVADHDARVGGEQLIPLKHFHIPALILGGDVQPCNDARIISQIDLAPTLLSLAGISSEHPMIGHDLTKPTGGGRAMMQFSDNYGYLKGDQLLVLEPHRPIRQFTYHAPDTYTAETVQHTLAQEALAHVLWPDWAYRHQEYTLPHLQARVAYE